MSLSYGSVPYKKENYKKPVRNHGYMIWDWNIDSMDWHYREKRLIHNTLGQRAAQTSSNRPLVILLHERKETVAQLLEYLSKIRNESTPRFHDAIHLKLIMFLKRQKGLNRK
jgi:peptidoglycan/xylan/chitin deacetylase (PgdA/CDA1 family)